MTKRSGKPDQERYHHGDLRQALIAGALTMVAEVGHHAVSLRDLARRLGVTHAAVYHHFGTRDALLVEVAASGFATLNKELSGVAERSSLPLDRLAAVTKTYAAFALSQASLYRLMFSADLANGEVGELRPGLDQLCSIFEQTVESCQRAQVMKPGRSADLALSLLASLHGICSLATTPSSRECRLLTRPAMDLVLEVLDAYFEGARSM